MGKKTIETRFGLWSCLMVLIALLAWPGDALCARDGGRESARRDQVSGRVAEHYPGIPDGEGRIDRIDRDGVVLNDSYYHFAEGARFHTPDQENTSMQYFKAGKRASFLLNAQRAITDLYLLPNGR